MTSIVWKKFAILCAALFVVVVIAVVAKQKPVVQQNGKLHILTTFLPMYVFTVNVAGEYADVENLLPGGVGPHEYSFTPADIQKIAAADVIVMNGLGLETWMQKLIAQSGTRAKTVVASDGIREPLIAGAEEGTPENPGTNPHVWLDPIRAKEMTIFIGEQLAAADPAHAAQYRSNVMAYEKKLTLLDQEYFHQLGLLQTTQLHFVAFHPAFNYLAERYGLTQVAVIEAFPGKEPSAQYLASIVDVIRNKNVRALFSEPQFSPRVIETVATETGRLIRPLDTVETGDFSTDTYVRAMQNNLQMLMAAFSQPQ